MKLARWSLQSQTGAHHVKREVEGRKKALLAREQASLLCSYVCICVYGWF